MEFGGSSNCTNLYEVLYLKTTNEDNFLIRDAPLEFEEDIKSTINELREINLGIEDPHPTFISSLLNE